MRDKVSANKGKFLLEDTDNSGVGGDLIMWLPHPMHAPLWACPKAVKLALTCHWLHVSLIQRAKNPFQFIRRSS